jgi:putative ABC transport system permease protein
MPASERWVRSLLRLYPRDFREDMGESFVEAYLDRCANAARKGSVALAAVWLRALGDSVINGTAERLNPVIAWRRSGDWGRDGELAVRRIVRSPVFALSTIATLTVGLGAFAVVTTVIDKILIAPLPYARPNDLYFVWRDYGKVIDLKRGWVSGPDVAALDTIGGPIAGAVGLRRDQRTMSIEGDEGMPEETAVMVASPKLFDLLGVHPIIGRGFDAKEVGENRTPLIVLGYDLWQRRFGGKPSALGAHVRLNGSIFTVIGVMGQDFRFVRHTSLGAPEAADVYITFPYDLATRSANAGSFAVLIRARPGASPKQVSSAVAAVGRSIDERFFSKRGIRLYPVGVQQDLVAGVRPALVVLGVSGIFLVLVLAANLAALLLSRVMQREREFAVARALGANGVALVRAVLLEGGMLGAVGGGFAALIAWWATRALVALAPVDLPRRESIALDWRMAIAITVVGALLGVLAGAAPAAWASRSTLASILRNAAVRGGGRGWLRRALVVVQVALCLVLLSTGGLVVRSFERLLQSKPGFTADRVLTFRVPIAPWRFPTNEAAVAIDDRIEHEVAALPGVESVSAASTIPLSANSDQGEVRLPGAPGNTGKTEHDQPLVDVMTARPGWFATLGTRMLQGREFSAFRPGSRREAIIDRTLAKQFYPSGSAVGQPIALGKDTISIVGVVDHARQYDLHQDGRPQVYLRDQDDTYGTLYFAVRSKRDPVDLIPDVRAIIRRLDPQLAVSDLRSLDDVVDDSLRKQRVSAVLIAGFSLGALLLAAVGLFGVVAGSVARRRHEIAVRLALGSAQRGVLRLILGEGLGLVAIGLILGAPGVYFAGHLVRGMLVGVAPSDPMTLAAVAIGLIAVAMIACYLPARRISGIDPIAALRDE